VSSSWSTFIQKKSRAIPLHPLWAVRPVQSLSACTRVHFTFTFYLPSAWGQAVQPYSQLPNCIQVVNRNGFTLILPLHDHIFNIHNLPQNFQERIWIIKTTIMYKFVRCCCWNNTFFQQTEAKSNKNKQKRPNQTDKPIKFWSGGGELRRCSNTQLITQTQRN